MLGFEQLNFDNDKYKRKIMEIPEALLNSPGIQKAFQAIEEQEKNKGSGGDHGESNPPSNSPSNTNDVDDRHPIANTSAFYALFAVVLWAVVYAVFGILIQIFLNPEIKPWYIPNA